MGETMRNLVAAVPVCASLLFAAAFMLMLAAGCISLVYTFLRWAGLF